MSTALLSCLSFNDVPIRMVGTPDAPEWVAADVGEALGIEKVRNTIEDFEHDEKGARSVGTPGGAQEMLTLTEPGLYRLIFISRKPDAAKFRRWVFHEVIPQIRRTGSYSVAPSVPRAEFDALAATVARLEKQASFGPHFGAEARLARLEAKVGQIPLFLEEQAPAKPKPNVRSQIRAREAARNAEREERLRRLVKVWGEEFGDRFTPLKEALKRSQRIADLAAELGDEIRHLLREANTRGLVEGQHHNKFNTKAWRPCAAERN